MNTALFYFFAILTAGSALALVLERNVVRMAVCLLFSLSGAAGLYFLLSAEFLAAAQLVIYVGGTLILIVFGVMLTNKSPHSRFQASTPEVIIGITVMAVLLAALLAAIISASKLLANAPATVTDAYPMNSLGQALLGDYLLPFELASVLLLVVMIGAAFLAKARKRNDPTKSATLGG